jgi:hypothetical protein
MLFLGFGFRRRGPRWLVLFLFAVGAMAGLASFNGCGGSNSVVTPGTYPFDVEASDINTGMSASTTITVTVP